MAKVCLKAAEFFVRTGIGSIQEGRYEEGWWAGGRHLRIGARSFDIQRVRLYRYR